MHEMLRIADPDAVGELLRSVTFPGEGFGCYSNFDVREGATKWSEERRRAYYENAHNSAGFVDPDEPEWEEARQEELELEVQAGESYSFHVDGLDVDVTWYWDGDGVLAYAVWDGPELIRTVVNTDCKKSHGWHDEYGGIDLVRGFAAAKALESEETALAPSAIEELLTAGDDEEASYRLAQRSVRDAERTAMTPVTPFDG